MSQKILRSDEVMRRLGVRKTTFWRMIKDGELPAPVNVTGTVNGFLESEIDAFIQSRIEAARGEFQHEGA